MIKENNILVFPNGEVKVIRVTNTEVIMEHGQLLDIKLINGLIESGAIRLRQFSVNYVDEDGAGTSPIFYTRSEAEQFIEDNLNYCKLNSDSKFYNYHIIYY